MAKIHLDLTEDEAAGLSQLVKRISRRRLGPGDLNLVTAPEADGADMAMRKLRGALAEAGYDPR